MRSTPSNQTRPEKPPSHVSEHFFDTPAYLTVSSQLYLEALASSISRVYTLQPAFRAEGSHTARHLSEFWMFEAEIAFIEDLELLMGVVEDSLKSLLTNLRISHQDRSNQNQVDGDGCHLPVWLQKPQNEPWKRITYTDAIEILNKTFRKPRERLAWGDSLTTNDERHLAGEWSGGVPVFVTNYPLAQKSFYMRTNESEEQRQTVACFDLLVPEIGELAGGSLREERETELRAAIERCGLDEPKYEWYIDLRR
jgi:asparaginyl-tRNA synthetase